MSGKPERDEYIKVYAAFDNEEVGSLSRQGASSDFLPVVLRELASVKDITGSGFNRMLSKSFMLSADNAHACIQIILKKRMLSIDRI